MHMWSGGWVSEKNQVIDRLAMRLNVCFPRTPFIYIVIQTWNQTKGQSSLGIVCLEEA